MSSELTDLKAADQAVWAGGDYDQIADHCWEVGAAVAGAVAIEAGMKVLDVATGTGSAAIRAAEKGADVVGLDISPEMLEGARRNAAEAGVEVEWVEGDAQALPFDDDSFDRVLTAFGTIHATDHDLAASELVRVCKPGGEIVMANWCLEGFPGRMLAMLRKHAPAEILATVAATEWGTHGHPRRQLGGQLVLAIEPAALAITAESSTALLEHYEQHFAPLVAAKASLNEQRYADLQRELLAWIEELDSGEGETVVAAPYVLVVGHKPVPDLRPNTA
jgi:ubiquinone/menaquinone biosynthesis C-methylase UbiE